MSKVLLVNGPSFYLDGNHRTDIYDITCVKEIEKRVSSVLCKKGISYKSIQSNSENEIVLWLKKQRDADFLLLNPGFLAKTSFELRDVVLEIEVPFLEVHLTNFYSCEESVYCSLFSEISIGTIVGLGLKGFLIASKFAVEFLEQETQNLRKI